MTLKRNIVTTIVGLSVIMIVGCKSNEQKTDDAFEQVKEEKEQTNDSAKINNAMTVVKSEAITDAKKNITDDRTQFKIETARKIQTNQNKITEMKSLRDADLNRKVTSLEKDNNDLIIKMDEYNKDEKLKWELFKANMNQHVNEIGIELKAIKINNNK